MPVTLTFRKDKLQPGGNPVLLTGYGAYGSSEAPTFPGYWMSLIDRGFILAQAHVRGGQEKGWRWYQQGHMLAKQNSFDDFIAATEALIAQGYADPRRIFARGASAGGLLVAAAVNRRPDLYAGVVAEVPFVDVITTMSDPGIPLTTLEYEEWGNPAIKTHFDAMMSYSPYDNVTAQSYPPMLVTAALNDSQVGFHEPAKWVARLRATKTDNNELLFVTSMNSGHSGKPGRFGPDEQNARIMAWLIAQIGAAAAYINRPRLLRDAVFALSFSCSLRCSAGVRRTADWAAFGIGTGSNVRGRFCTASHTCECLFIQLSAVLSEVKVAPLT